MQKMENMHETPWEELDITNDFLFGKVMRNSEICKQVLETILNIEIDRIEYPEEQKSIDMTVDAKSVRLDVYVRDFLGTVYNIEMRTTNTGDLPKRSRYYQGMIDLDLIEKGALYRELNKSIIIFICTFDLFGENRYMYTFENRCIQNPKLALRDETRKIFLNSKGDVSEASENMKAFLSYLNGNISDNPFVIRLDSAVHKARTNQEWRREYMKLLQRDKENFERGVTRGIQQGRDLERENTKKEARRAEAAEKEVERLRALLRERETEK